MRYKQSNTHCILSDSWLNRNQTSLTHKCRHNNSFNKSKLQLGRQQLAVVIDLVHKNAREHLRQPDKSKNNNSIS
jgi:hypothetical protein